MLFRSTPQYNNILANNANNCKSSKPIGKSPGSSKDLSASRIREAQFKPRRGQKRVKMIKKIKSTIYSKVVLLKLQN